MELIRSEAPRSGNAPAALDRLIETILQRVDSGAEALLHEPGGWYLRSEKFPFARTSTIPNAAILPLLAGHLIVPASVRHQSTLYRLTRKGRNKAIVADMLRPIGGEA